MELCEPYVKRVREIRVMKEPLWVTLIQGDYRVFLQIEDYDLAHSEVFFRQVDVSFTINNLRGQYDFVMAHMLSKGKTTLYIGPNEVLDEEDVDDSLFLYGIGDLSFSTEGDIQGDYSIQYVMNQTVLL